MRLSHHIGGHGRIRIPDKAVTGGTAPFDPLSLSPFVWFDFSALGLADGASIASISDLSGNGHTASQATGAKQPIFKAAIQNGLGVGRFTSASSQELLTAAFAQAQPFVVYAVVANAVGSSGRYFSDAGGGVRVGSAAGLPGHDDYAGTVFQKAYAAGTFQSWRQITTVINGAATIARSNGAQDGTSGAVGANNIGSGIALGSQGGAQFWSGDYGEVFAVAGSSVSTAAEAYLKSKWATP